MNEKQNIQKFEKQNAHEVYTCTLILYTLHMQANKCLDDDQIFKTLLIYTDVVDLKQSKKFNARASTKASSEMLFSGTKRYFHAQSSVLHSAR